jgi:hypothetical protein
MATVKSVTKKTLHVGKCVVTLGQAKSCKKGKK